MKIRTFIFALIVLLLTLSLISTPLAQQDTTKAKFGYAFQIKPGLKYHIFNNCFTLKNKTFVEVQIDSAQTCKNCVNRLYAEEEKKKAVK